MKIKKISHIILILINISIEERVGKEEQGVFLFWSLKNRSTVALKMQKLHKKVYQQYFHFL